MKVKLLISRGGVGFTQNAGDEIDVDNDEAKRMMEANPPQCVPVRATKSEKAVRSTKKSEKTVKK